MSHQERICGTKEHRARFPACVKCAAKIEKIAAQLEVDAAASHKKKERDESLHKRIHEVDTDKNYSGEASPYWDHLATQQDTTGEGMHVLEDALANPDALGDDKTPFNRPLSSDGELQMQAVHETLERLTPLQKRIVRLSYEGVWSYEEGRRVYSGPAIARELGITQQAVSRVLVRVRANIRRCYDRLKMK